MVAARHGGIQMPVNPMSLPKDQAWFTAKKYGYVWGLPARWQGWSVMLAHVITLALSAIAFARARPFWFFSCTFLLSLLFVLVCVWKGERPRWRWGGTDDEVS